MKPVRRQTIVIMGASSGIGLATARLAARRGARVVLAARSARALAQLTREIGEGSGSAVAVVADVTKPDDVQRVADEAIRTFGGFDTWINNAAVSAYGSCLDVSLDDARRIMDTNFWGTVHGSRVAVPYLRTRGGALINVGSVLSDRAVPLQGAYSASKHAVKGWTDALRTELMHEHAPVSVTLIKPAAIDTPYAEHARNYLPDQPTHTVPVYDPASAAEAILYAASHQVRDIIVGSGGVVLSLAAALVPRTTDVLLTRLLLPALHSGRPPHGRPILYEPSEDLRERGEYPGLVRRSLTTTLITRPWLGRALVIGALAAIAMGWRARRGSDVQIGRHA